MALVTLGGVDVTNLGDAGVQLNDSCSVFGGALAVWSGSLFTLGLNWVLDRDKFCISSLLSIRLSCLHGRHPEVGDWKHRGLCLHWKGHLVFLLCAWSLVPGAFQLLAEGTILFCQQFVCKQVFLWFLSRISFFDTWEIIRIILINGRTLHG